MLYRYSEVFRTLLWVSDGVLLAAAWGGAYALRFGTERGLAMGGPGERSYLLPLLLILPLFTWLFRSRALYAPRRTGSMLRELGAILSAVGVGVVVMLAADAALRTFYSRAVILLFAGLSVVLLTASRVAIRGALRRARRRGYNLRYLLVVGAGELAEQVIERVHAHPEAGLRVVGVLSEDPAWRGRTVHGVAVLAGYGAVKEVLRRQRIDQVIVALPKEDAPQLEKLLADLDDELVSVQLVPDLLHVLTLRSSVEELDGLPVINLRESPLLGWAAVQKRVFDVAVASAALVLAAPVLAAIALAVWISSGRPILYAQERMGLDGRVFRMLKFRTMRTGAEEDSGPVWARPDDPRRTRLGSFLRGTSLDEFPQLWNVLRGDMSLVGPRPERPVFIEQFRREVPGYMLRHKVKAGVTGWAQVHGWRGNTSLQERLEHDIYYIQNWSLGLDLRILFLTVLRGFLHRNAY
jgi:Undecaprenyl-phosphate glucose phosphotransferase